MYIYMHCIVSGDGLIRDGKIRKSSSNFFIRTEVLRDRFKGKYMAHLSSLYEHGSLMFSASCEKLRNPDRWKDWKMVFMKRTGVLTSRKPLTALVMPSNIWDAIPTKSPSPTAGSFLFPRIKLLFLPEGKAGWSEASDYTESHILHQTLPDACVTFPFSKDTLLWIPEQPDEA